MSQLKKYRKVKYLGKGSYGAAILVELRADPSQKFVIKEIVIGHLKPAEQQSAKNEAEVLHQMNHSNITSYIESFVENSKLYIVMEHADGGDLSSAIQKKKGEGKYWEEEEVMRIFVQICLALKHVHSANILHRDLKSQNIFLTQKGMVKLGDFGIAKVLDASDDQARTQIGTPYYLSPEICESKPYGRKSDVWSLGVVLYELLALEMPFQANSLPALVHRICSAEPSYSKLESRYSQALLSLCKSLLLKNPDQRPEVGQFVRTDFLKDHISRLLSYTLKSGTGGVAGLAAPHPDPAAAAHQMRNFDPDEADHKIEQYREREKDYLRNHRDAEAKEVMLQKDRQQQSEEAREKARKIRQEMIQNNQARRRPGEEMKVYEGKEAENYVARGGGGGRPLSPKSNNNRALSPKSNNSNRPLSPKGNNNRALSPKSAAISAARNNARQVRDAPAVNPFQRQPSNNNNNNNVNRGVKSLAEINAERQQIEVVVAAPRGGGGGGGAGRGNYEDYARREYFERRAAAQAAKAKVEAYEREGYDRGGNNNNAVVLHNGRRPSDSESVSQRDRYADLDPEQRIAMLKAQREKEREREREEKEMQMKLAIEEQREQRRRSEANRAKAIAFEIDINSDKVEAKNLKVRAGGGVVAEDFIPSSNNDPPSQRNNQNRKAAEDSHSQPTSQKVKKGWGPPVEGSDILQARGIAPSNSNNSNKSPSSDRTPPSNRYPPSSRRGGGEGKEHSNSNSDIEDFSSDPPANYRDEEPVEDNREIIKRLENKRRSQLEMRHQAREVLSKLREQRQLQAKNRNRNSTNSVNSSNNNERMMVMGEGRSAANRRSPLRNRERDDSRGRGEVSVTVSGKERRPSGTESKLADATPAAAVGGAPPRSRSNSHTNNNDDELEDTISTWLDQQKRAVTVRKKPSRGLSPKRSEGKDAKEILLAEDEDQVDEYMMVHEDEDVQLYKSFVRGGGDQRQYQYQRGDSHHRRDQHTDDVVEEDLVSPSYREDIISQYGDENDDDRPLKGKYIDGDDVEVVGMQCMLARALMGDDDD